MLNFISLNGTLQNEVEQVIENRVKKAGERKLFYNEKVIVDSDLIPGAETNPSLRGETTIEQYLLNFHTGYAKTDDPTVTMMVLEISPLKQKEYLFYNVIFKCAFSGKSVKGESYPPVTRVAEIGLVKENRWRLYIRAIRFPLGNETDAQNAFTGITKTETEVEKLLIQ
ncbi:MAG: hypothetical protein IPP71_09660 [Bacteroidetes bacterium]|nr:hypothetical protein [Bacteroidota bacterium]